jgi:cell division protease FtsH
MVTKWGLSDNLGPLTYGEEEGEVFLGREMSRRKGVSDATAQAIDVEIRLIIDRNYLLAEKILKDNMDKLHLMADALIKYETIGDPQIQDILAGRQAQPPSEWIDDDFSSPNEPPVDQNADKDKIITQERVQADSDAATS